MPSSVNIRRLIRVLTDPQPIHIDVQPGDIQISI